jgi:hypothetical protein
MPARKKPLRVSQTALVDVADALHNIGCVAHVAVAALMRQSGELVSLRTGKMLYENVVRPLEKQEAIVEAHAKRGHVEALVKPRRRKKRAPNGSRKGKKRQRNRWKDRQKALKPLERQRK